MSLSSGRTGLPKPGLLTGRPAFAEPLHVGRPNLGNREALFARLTSALERRWLTNNGPLVQEFEERVREHLDVRHCVALANGTLALELAIRALGLTGEVIVPSFTFVATVHALQWQGVTPVFCDIDPVTHNLDPEQVEQLCTGRTSAILAVHVWGRACDVERLETISRRRGLKLLFDASHAFACSHRGRLIGGFGDAEVFSFHATKFVHCGEGGAVVTNNDELAGKLRLMRNFGFAGYDNVVCLGTNAKMSELNAAMGLTSLEGMPSFIAVNRARHTQYGELLSSLPGIQLVTYSAEQAGNYQYVVVEVDESECPLARDELLSALHADNVLARRYFYPGCHRAEPYRSEHAAAASRLPTTELICRRVLQLPTGTAVTEEQVALVVRAVESALLHAQNVRSALQVQSSKGGP